MLKIFQGSKFLIIRPFRQTFATVSPTFQEDKSRIHKKPYEILFSTSLELSPKLPSANILRSLKSRKITYIMAQNHSLKHEGVLQAHVECLYALISRVEPSIEGVTLFVDYIFKVMVELNSKNESVVEQALKRSCVTMMKPRLLTKLVRIIQTIDSFYNEYLRMMMANFIIKIIQHSEGNEYKRKEALLEVMAIKKSVLSGQPRAICEMQEEPIMLTPETIGKYVEAQKININESFPVLSVRDIFHGMQYVMSVGYYSDDFLNITVKQLLNPANESSSDIEQVTIQIKTIISLEKYKRHKIIADQSYSLFGSLYQKAVGKYFQLLQNNKIFFQALHSEEALIQSGLVTQFLTQEHRLKAKTIYMKIFKNILNSLNNGALMFDIKKFRGIFEVILIMFTHEDTRDVHELLLQTEKIMTMYPIARFQKLETHCMVAQKYGFKSDVFASLYFSHLVTSKDKIDRNKGLIHTVHQFTRELALADKFLTYLSLGKTYPSEPLSEANELASELFETNIWICLNDSEPSNLSFLSNPSFGTSIFFRRSSLNNLTANMKTCKKIEQMIYQAHIRSINKYQSDLLKELTYGSNRFNLRSDHHSSWRNNQHARLVSILRLANHHFNHVKKNKSSKEAYAFIDQFLKKILGSHQIYAIIKNNFNYPEVLAQLFQLFAKTNKNNFPVVERDIAAVSRLLAQQSLKVVKQPEVYNLYYQENLQDIEHNRVMIPYVENYYSVSGTAGHISQGLLYHAMRRYYLMKENLKMQIDTFCKFQLGDDVKVVTNYLEFPHLADLKITIKDEVTVLFFNYEGSEQRQFLNEKQLAHQRNSELYWSKLGVKVVYIRSEKDIEEFMENKIKKLQFAEKRSES